MADYPLDLVRTRLTAAVASGGPAPRAWSVLRDVLRTEGVLGLYRGLVPTASSTGPTMAVNYGVYETLRDLYLQHARGPQGEALVQPPTWVAMLLGSATGLASSLLLYPTDLVRRRVQMQGPGARVRTLAVARDVLAREGLRGFYHGFSAEAFKVMPGMAIAFMSYEAMKMLLGIQQATRVR